MDGDTPESDSSEIPLDNTKSDVDSNAIPEEISGVGNTEVGIYDYEKEDGLDKTGLEVPEVPEVDEFENGDEAGEEGNFDGKKEKEEEEDDNVEEKEERSIWERMKRTPHILHYKIDHYFNGGTPEQNKNRKVIVAAIGIGAVTFCIAVGVDKANDVADVVQGKAIVGSSLPDVASNTGGVITDGRNAGEVLGAIGSGNIVADTVNYVGSSFNESLSQNGDTIWNHAENILKKWGVEPTYQNILRLTSDVLKGNGLSWSEARNLPAGYDFVVNQPIWAQ